MENVIVLFSKLLSLAVISIISYVAYSKGILKREHKDAIATLLNRITLPLVIIASYAKVTLTKELLINGSYIIVAYLVIYLISFVSTIFLAKSFKLSKNQKSVYLNGSLHTNVAFLGFPLLLSLFGEIGFIYGSIYFLADNFTLFTSGISRFQTKQAKFKLHPVTMSLFIGILIMVVASITKLNFVDNFLFEGINSVGSLTTPLSFLFIGMIVYENNPLKLLNNIPALTALLNKMVIIPFIMCLIFKFIHFDIPSIVIMVILVQALMPPFSSLLAMAFEYKQDVDMAASMVVVGHILAAFTIPIMYFIISSILG